MTSPFIPALPTLSPRALWPRTVPRLRPFPFDQLAHQDGRAQLYYLARNGIYHGLRVFGLGPGDAVLMPSYHHGVEVEAVRQLGAVPSFYQVGSSSDGDPSWQMDIDDIRRRARQPGVRAIYVTHMAGWPQPVDEIRGWARGQGLLVVEDCALSLLAAHADGRPLGQNADLAVYCLYKTLPLPHGGLAVARWPLPSGRRPPLYSTLHNLGGAMLAHGELRLGPIAGRLRAKLQQLMRSTVDRALSQIQVGTLHLRPEELGLGASRFVERFIERFGQDDAARVVARRRRNFSMLLDSLGDARHTAVAHLPVGACPLFFPLLVEDRRAVLEKLWSRGVEAVDFWSVGDAAAAAAEFPAAARLRRTLIEIPLHQGLDDVSMKLVARAVKDVLAHG